MRQVATGRSLAPNEWFPSAQPHPARRATAPHLVRARSASRSPLVGRIAVPSQVGADVFAKRPISPGDQLAGDLGQRLVARGPGRRCSFVFSAASRASAGLARGSAPSTPNRPVNRRIRLLRDRRGVVGLSLRHASVRRGAARGGAGQDNQPAPRGRRTRPLPQWRLGRPLLQFSSTVPLLAVSGLPILHTCWSEPLKVDTDGAMD